MRMNMIAKTLAPALLLASASALHGQATAAEPMKAYISFGQNIANNHAVALSGQPWGGPGSFLAEFGLEFYHPATTLLVRPNAGYTVYDLLGVFIGFDLVYNVSKKLPITLTAGPSFHAWSVEQCSNVGWYYDSAAEVYKPPTTPPYGSNMIGERSLKLGWRMGLGYDVKVMGRQFRADLTYTMTEWRSRNNEPYRHGFNPSLPSYFTFKGSYTF